MDFAGYLLTATALIFVIEGLLYAMFPDFVRKMMAIAITLPVQRLRFIGFSMALAGCLAIWILKKLSLL
jgi:hypothetical protein